MIKVGSLVRYIGNTEAKRIAREKHRHWRPLIDNSYNEKPCGIVVPDRVCVGEDCFYVRIISPFAGVKHIKQDFIDFELEEI